MRWRPWLRAAPAGRAAFARDTLDDPAIARLRHAVRLQPYAPIAPWPKDRPGRVTWRLSDGEVWTEAVENARGGADQPFSTDELLGKIDELTRAVFPAMSGVLRALIVDPHARGSNAVARRGRANDEAMRADMDDGCRCAGGGRRRVRPRRRDCGA